MSEKVFSTLLERVRRIESDAAAVYNVLEKMSERQRAAADRSGPDTAAAEHERARRPLQPGEQPVSAAPGPELEATW